MILFWWSYLHICSTINFLLWEETDKKPTFFFLSDWLIAPAPVIDMCPLLHSKLPFIGKLFLNSAACNKIWYFMKQKQVLGSSGCTEQHTKQIFSHFFFLFFPYNRFKKKKKNILARILSHSLRSPILQLLPHRAKHLEPFPFSPSLCLTGISAISSVTGGWLSGGQPWGTCNHGNFSVGGRNRDSSKAQHTFCLVPVPQKCYQGLVKMEIVLRAFLSPVIFVLIISSIL